MSKPFLRLFVPKFLICLFQNPTKFYHANAFSFWSVDHHQLLLLVPPNSPYATMVLTSIMNRHYMNTLSNKANLRDLIAATDLVMLLKLDSNRRFFSPCDLEIWWIIEHLFYTTSMFLCIISNPSVNSNWSYSPETLNWIDDFFSCVTLKFDGWPWKTTGHFFYTTASFVHHFVDIDEFKLELQSGNAQFGTKSMIFKPCDLEIWRMTLKNNRAPLLCYFKFCASFRSHWWIDTRATVRTRPIWVKFDIFF